VRSTVKRIFLLIRFQLKAKVQQAELVEKEVNVLIAVSVQVVGTTVVAKEVVVNVVAKAVAIVVTLQVEINHAVNHIS
jgi:hypothetical protein